MKTLGNNDLIKILNINWNIKGGKAYLTFIGKADKQGIKLYKQ